MTSTNTHLPPDPHQDSRPEAGRNDARPSEGADPGAGTKGDAFDVRVKIRGEELKCGMGNLEDTKIHS